MLYGCCVNLLPKTLDRIGLEYAGRLKRLGYDYIELPLNELAQLSEQEFRDARTVLEELDLPCRACNDFYARPLSDHRLRRHLQSGADRLPPAGPGAGGPAGHLLRGLRQSLVPQLPRALLPGGAFGQIAEFLSLAGEEAAPYQVVIAIEPINRGETNMLNHFSDGVRMARTVDYPNVRVLCDYYHLRFEGDSPSVLLDGGRELLVHTHISQLEGRRYPTDLSLEPTLPEYAGVLRQIGYAGGGERRVQGGCPGALGGAGGAGPGESQAGAGLTVPPPSFNIFLS